MSSSDAIKHLALVAIHLLKLGYIPESQPTESDSVQKKYEVQIKYFLWKYTQAIAKSMHLDAISQRLSQTLGEGYAETCLIYSRWRLTSVHLFSLLPQSSLLSPVFEMNKASSVQWGNIWTLTINLRLIIYKKITNNLWKKLINCRHL